MVFLSWLPHHVWLLLLASLRLSTLLRISDFTINSKATHQVAKLLFKLYSYNRLPVFILYVRFPFILLLQQGKTQDGALKETRSRRLGHPFANCYFSAIKLPTIFVSRLHERYAHGAGQSGTKIKGLFKHSCPPVYYKQAPKKLNLDHNKLVV